MRQIDQEFDYVVAGGGTAGCALAARLSEDPGVRVALLEAGPRDTMWAIKVPAAFIKAIGNDRINWKYVSAPQQGMGGKSFYIPRGKVLGGSGSINGMVYSRGHPGDYDDWEKLGNAGWSYADVLPYFLRSEDNADFRDSPYHGVGGPMRIADPRCPNPLIGSFVEAAQQLGFTRNPDFNAADPTGFGLRQAANRGGVRESTSTAFLRHARHRPNLTIVTGALVDRVHIEQKRATAVDFEADGQRHRFAARKEIILCGGAYGSPAILQRSGIGDAARLADLGIACAHHLPGVGMGLRDHPSAAVQMVTRDATSYGLSVRSFPRSAMHVLRYLAFRSGPIGGNILEATGFVKTRSGEDRPDLQLVFMPAHLNPKRYSMPVGHGFSILSIAVRPKASGSVWIASPDPHAPPTIDPDFLGHQDDIDTIRAGLLLSRRLFAAPAFARYRASEFKPGADVTDAQALDAHIRDTTVTVHHPACSARMGTDGMAVVDARLRVHGIEGLRVADASVLPTITAGNTNAPVVMVAEKAADMILGRAPPPPLDVEHAA